MEAKILLDTNFLLIPAEFRVDIFSELERLMDRSYTVYILDKSVEELQHIQQVQKGKNREAAKIALQLINKQQKAKHLNIIAAGHGSVDDAIVELADKDYIVGTQDRMLRRRLRQKNIKLLSLREKNHLTIL